jgi:hypothetical protein
MSEHSHEGDDIIDQRMNRLRHSPISGASFELYLALRFPCFGVLSLGESGARYIDVGVEPFRLL